MLRMFMGSIRTSFKILARKSYLNRYVRSEQRAKTANWPRPRGLRCVGEASSLCPLPEKAKRGRFAYIALPAAHFDRNERYAYFGDRKPNARIPCRASAGSRHG